MKVIIRKVGRLDPRDSVEYYKNNPQVFRELKQGKNVEVPEEVALQLYGVEVVEIIEETEKKKSKRGKKVYFEEEVNILEELESPEESDD